MFPVQDATVDGHKYAGRSRAVVIDNKDPDKRGRIRVLHPLVGETVWINYLKTPGFFDVPSIDDIVYVEADSGFETHLVAWGNIIKGAEGDPQIPEEFQRVNPTNRGIYTPGGHLIEVDDGDETGQQKGIRITASNGSIVHINSNDDSITIKSNYGDELSVSKDNGIQGSTPAGDGTTLSMKSGEVNLAGGSTNIKLNNDTCEITDNNGNTIVSTSSGVKIEDLNGNTIETSSNGVKIKDSALGELNIAQGKVALGNATVELLSLLNEAFIALSTQTAAGFNAPTSTVAKFQELSQKLSNIMGSL